MTTTAPVTLQVDTEALNRLNRKLVDYHRVLGRLTIPEVLEKKGTDVRLRLWRLFWDQKFGGRGRKNESIAMRELKRRAKAGAGILVRLRELSSKWGGAPEIAAGRKRKGYKLSLWQKLVWQELERRKSGIGVLAIGFLSKQFQRGFRAPQGRAETTSKATGTMVRLTLTPTSYTIEGFTPGLVEVANRYGIADKAIAEAEKDIDVYLTRKLNEARAQVFGNN